MGWCGARFLAELDHTRDHDVIDEAASTTPTTAPLAAATLRTATPEATVRTAVVRTALVAAGDTESVRDRLGDRHAVALHTVTDVAVWERMVRVGCLLAGAEQDGATSVIALRTALADHDLGPCRRGRFTWARPRSPRSRPARHHVPPASA